MISQVKMPKLRFEEFTDEWQVKKLGDIFDVRDGTHESPIYISSGKALMTSKNLTPSGKLDLQNVSYISQQDFETINKRSGVDVDDILFGMIGTIGNPVKVTSNDFAIKNVALLKQKNVKSNYMIQYLRTQIIDKQFYQKNAGGTQKFISLSDIRSLDIGLSSKPEQEKIAGFLTVVDERVELAEKRVELLKNYKKSMMQKIFTQKIRFKNENGDNYPDWTCLKLGDIGTTYSGLTGKSGDDFGSGVNYITYMQIFNDSKIDASKCLKVRILPHEKQNKVMKGDIFFTISSETPREVGYTSVLLDEVDELYLNSFCFGYRTEGATLMPEFARYIFHSQGIRKSISRLAQGSTRFNLSKNELMKIGANIPNSEEQQKIADFLTSLDDKINIEEVKLIQAKNFKKSLLQRMFV